MYAIEPIIYKERKTKYREKNSCFLNFLNKKQSILYILLLKNYSFHRQQDTLLLLPAALPSSFLLQLPIKKNPSVKKFMNVAQFKTNYLLQ